MLDLLKIENIAVIESAEIEFSKGFNILSGETGAGKSIILDSISAVLGYRTSRELIRTGAEESRVTALFSEISDETENVLNEYSFPLNDDGTLVLSRVISESRNICRVNDTVTTAAVLRKIGATLLNTHGQQDNRELQNSETHISYIDALADISDLKDEYTALYGELTDIKRQIKSLSSDKAEKARQIDILSFQIDELESADIKSGEWENLKSRRDELLNYEKIRDGFNAAYSSICGDESFSGALETVSGALREISSLSNVSQTAEKLSERLNNIYYELSDISEEMRDSLSDEGFSQSELEEIENRIDLLYKLSKKYGSTEDEMLEFLENAQKELDNITFSDEKLEKLNKKYGEVYEKTLSLAEKISEIRRKTAKDFESKVSEELKFLDMPYVKFLVEFEKTELTENGIDNVCFYISANAGEEPKPIGKVASGGELSRIMLALKTVIAGKDNIGTLVFDEVDAGVSGRAALKVAAKLKEVSKGRQVLCVTHLAQLMAYADVHFLIEKSVKNGKTYTKVSPLDFDGRKHEIARITSGGEITDIQLKNAEEMINNTLKGDLK